MFPEPMKQCVEVVTHWGPHPDEAYQYWVARKWGLKHFPGIRDAKVVFRTKGGLYKGKNWREHYDKGVLLLGTGGGLFDEHAVGSEYKKEGETGATLMSNFLALGDDPALFKILRYVHRNDSSGSHQNLIDLAHQMRNATLYSNTPQIRILIRAVSSFEDWYRKNRAVLSCRQELEALKKSGRLLVKTVAAFGQKIKIAAVDGIDNPEVSGFLKRLGVEIVILKNTRGQVQILPNQRLGINLDRAAEKICLVEPGLWHYAGWALLNGSHSYPGTEATKVGFREIVQIIISSITS